MYPKTIFFNMPAMKCDNSFLAKKIPVSKDMSQSHLIFQTEYQFVDIGFPYLIMYESVDPKANSTVYMEFSEERQLNLSSPYREYRNLDRRLHSHDFYEITYVLSGNMTMRIEDESVRYGAGDCCVCNKNVHHLEVMDEKTELFLLLIKEDMIRDLLYDAGRGEARRTGMEQKTVFDYFFAENLHSPLEEAKVYADFRRESPADQKPFLVLLNQIIEEIASYRLGKRFMMKALLCRLIEYLQTEPSFRVGVHSAQLSKEEQIIHAIAMEYQKRPGMLTRAEIEKLTGYCGDHVERIVKRHTGMSLKEYGRMFLLQKAAALLKESDHSVGDVCDALGYANRTFFNREFKKRYGVTPAAYRKQRRALEEGSGPSTPPP